MRQGPHNKRGRGRGGNRRVGVPNRNQTFDSNGPDVRIRGSAHQVHEKYLTLARDASASGDRVLAESYFQHAEHYFRILNAFSEESGNDGNRARANGNGGRHVFDGEQPQPDIAPPAPTEQRPAAEAAEAAPAETDTAAPQDEPAKPALSLRRRTNGARDRSDAGAEPNGSGAVTVTVIEPGSQQPGVSAAPLRRSRSSPRARQGREDAAPGRTEGSED